MRASILIWAFAAVPTLAACGNTPLARSGQGGGSNTTEDTGGDFAGGVETSTTTTTTGGDTGVCPVGTGRGCCDSCDGCAACIFVTQCPTQALLSCLCQADVCLGVCAAACVGMGIEESGPCVDCALQAMTAQCSAPPDAGACLPFGD